MPEHSRSNLCCLEQGNEQEGKLQAGQVYLASLPQPLHGFNLEVEASVILLLLRAEEGAAAVARAERSLRSCGRWPDESSASGEQFGKDQKSRVVEVAKSLRPLSSGKGARHDSVGLKGSH